MKRKVPLSEQSDSKLLSLLQGRPTILIGVGFLLGGVFSTTMRSQVSLQTSVVALLLCILPLLATVVGYDYLCKKHVIPELLKRLDGGRS